MTKPDETYAPQPIETSAIKLPTEVLDLTERLAAHNHDIWARQRIAEGWTWGPNRDDEQMTHPDLVPYDDLSDGEKNYDRETAQQVLKAIIALGYSIEKRPAER